MDSGTALLLSIAFTAITLYVLFFVVRAAVEAGIRRALPDSLLRGVEPMLDRDER